MDPLSALSVASAVIQIVDFSSRVIARTREVYCSADGVIEETMLLEAAAANLDELMTQLLYTRPFLQEREQMKTSENKTADGHFVQRAKDAFGNKAVDDQLMQLARDSQAVAASLQDTLNRVKRKKNGSERNAWAQGFQSVVEQKKVSGLAEKLDHIRKQVDTTLLVSLRQRIDVIDKVVHSNNNEQRKGRVDILTSLKDKDWKPTERKDVSEFSEYLMASVDMDMEERFFKMILHRLYFTDFSDRFESIPEAHRDTFRWMFESDPQQYNPNDWDSFTEWLSGARNENLFWATGKPGSGKSTLMKFLFNDERTSQNLKAWTNDRPLVKAGFFFWNSGTVMQMSRMGLLQSLLYTSLSKDRETVMSLFKYRWEQFVAIGGGRQPFSWTELRQALETMIATPKTPKTFFFMIDGLDEFDGDPKDMIDLVLTMSRHAHVKVCVASRPWLVFSDAFEGRPSLLLERLTKSDIKKYIGSSFANNKHYARLSKLESDRASALVNGIADKAQGVFLWVYLVVHSLLDGLSNADRMTDLVARLEVLPPGLEELYAKLLQSLDANYLKHACQLFRLMMLNQRLYLLELYFADNEKDDSAMSGSAQELSVEQVTECLETMQRRLNSRCKGFLETDNWHTHPGKTLTRSSSVGWIHSTARDFLQTETMRQTILDTTGHDSFDPERHWANGYLGMLKSLSGSEWEKWQEFMWCIEYAIRLESRFGICPVDYLDEVDKTAKKVCPVYRDSRFATRVGLDSMRKLPKVYTFLDFAVWYGLAGYIRIKGPKMSRQALLHASQFQSFGTENRALWIDDRAAWEPEVTESYEVGDGRRSSRYATITSKPQAVRELNVALKLQKKKDLEAKWTKAKKRMTSFW